MARTNIIDRTIGYFAPKTGAKRASYRRQMDLQRSAQRYYEAAGGGRLATHWNAPSGDADTAMAKSSQLLRDRSREAVRNNPLAGKIATTHANYLVGSGIIPRAKTGKPELDKSINELFEEWSVTCHVAGTQDFYGICYSMAYEMVVSGEMFVRKRSRMAKDGLKVPLQLQVLDSEFCEWGKNGEVASNPVINGIEYDMLGRRRGYWMHKSNPLGRTMWKTLFGGSTFVPAEDIVHVFEPKGTNSRDVPWLTPILTELKDLRDYELSENIRKKVESCAVGVVTDAGEESEDPNIGIDETLADPGRDPMANTRLRDAYGHPLERMEPGLFVYARPGQNISFNTPAISAGMESYIRTRHRSIAAGARIPYELLIQDYSQSNFASGKLGILDYKVFVDRVQWNILIRHMTVIYGWFVEHAKLAGHIPQNAIVKVEWQPPEFASIDRLDEARADLLDVRMGKRSPQEIIAKTGRDPDTVLAETDEWFSKVDKTKSGLIFDNDPRKTAINGQLQALESEKKPDGE